ncbi:SusC/RagA family TonB-linked outer membrane protein [Maribellus luteus]|uniref:SusC/RagA family TonB-linked outer membrane protein n=2 Tax=Prolixibacteraceae TaxID=1471398 RepID=A0A399T6M7_9BACT|nr:SusC/RagA family TonB-linked outer membrane protein [Maribellus luteus]RIJ50525.1 SusC/RagA family TonB-linked outer membrane protein [Maribellus luteus]
MKKNIHLQERGLFFSLFKKAWLIMKLTVIFTLFCVFHALAGISQDVVESVEINNAPLEEFLSAVEKQTSVKFLYRYENIEGKRVSINIKNASVDEILTNVLPEQGLTYSHLRNNLIVISADQERIIIGKVVDKDNQPLVGVNVIIKGTLQGSVTNVDGEYQISVPNDQAILQFSYIGFEVKEVLIGEQNTINVTLYEDSKSIEEVVVTALGIEKKKKTLTYSTQEVDMEGMTTIKDLSLGNALAGKVAGVSITSSSGASGVSGDPRIIIRGDRSIQNNNQPLIVIDGIPQAFAESIAPNMQGQPRPPLDNLSSINADDIQSMNVLKGPAASALYGSSANNGVIVITTKRGVKGKPRITVNSVTNFDLPYLYPEFQNEYAQGAGGIYQATAANTSWGPKMTGQSVQNWKGETVALTPQPDNVKDLFSVGYNLTNSFSYSAGSEKSSSYFSYSNTTARGVLEDNKMVRHNLNLRLTAELLENLNLDFKITHFRQTVKDQPTSGDNLFSPMWQLVKMPRSMRTADIENGSYLNDKGELTQNTWAPESTDNINPYWAMEGFELPSTLNRVNSFLSLRYNFSENLFLQVRGGMNISNSDNEERTYWGTPYIYSGFGNYKTSFDKIQNLNSDILLAFDKELNKDFRVGFNLGAEVKDMQRRGQWAEARGLSMMNKFALNFAKNVITEDLETRIQKQSVYGMGQFSFRNYLFLDVTARKDWSSTLPEPHDYFYPSVGLSGIISDMVKLPDAITFVKLRGSYAEVGNDAGFASIFQAYNSDSSGPLGMITPQSTKVAEQLIPEKTKSWEAGADLKFFDNRLGVDLTWYKSNTYNQLVRITNPPTSGYSSAWLNCGNIQNTGVEIMLYVTPVKTHNFNWDVSLNFARNKNEVVELTEFMDRYEVESPNLSMGETWIIEGRPFGEIFTYGFERNGDGKVIVGSNGIPLIDHGKADVYLGNFNYDWRSGLINSFNYKNWHMSFLIDLNYGGVRQSATEAMMLSAGTSKASLVGREDGIIVDGVKEDGSVNDIRISAEDYYKSVGGRINSGTGELFSHDATNSRLREFSLGYNFPIRNSVVKSLKVSAVGRNLFYIYNGCDWFDPDVSYDVGTNGQGSESAFLPGTRTLGFNVKFTL